MKRNKSNLEGGIKMKKNSIFNLLKLEYKNKNYRNIIRYLTNTSICIGSIVLTALMIYVSPDKFATNLSICCFLTTVFLFIKGLKYERDYITPIDTNYMKNYLSSISDKNLKEEKAVLIVRKMTKNKNMTISLGQFNNIKENVFVPTTIRDSEKHRIIVDNLIEKNKQEMLEHEQKEKKYI